MKLAVSSSSKEIIYGIHAVREAINSGREIDRVLIQKNANKEGIRDLLDAASELNIPLQSVPVEKLNRVTRKNHQGVICFISAIAYASLDHVISDSFSSGKSPLILMLDGVTDVRNFGSIARTAEVAGVDAIVIPFSGSAQINSDAIKTSSGALNHLPVCREKDLLRNLKYLQSNGLQAVACTEKASQPIYEINFTLPSVIVLGSEEKGISNSILKTVDLLGRIPISGKIASLNVSVAAGIVMFEAKRQRI